MLMTLVTEKNSSCEGMHSAKPSHQQSMDLGDEQPIQVLVQRPAREGEEADDPAHSGNACEHDARPPGHLERPQAAKRPGGDAVLQDVADGLQRAEQDCRRMNQFAATEMEALTRMQLQQIVDRVSEWASRLRSLLDHWQVRQRLSCDVFALLKLLLEELRLMPQGEIEHALKESFLD